jgi:hypothetical protein
MHTYEFRVLVALHFEIRVPTLIVEMHLKLILRMCDASLETFIGEAAVRKYQDDKLKKDNQRIKKK